jgi:hypothetical protein
MDDSAIGPIKVAFPTTASASLFPLAPNPHREDEVPGPRCRSGAFRPCRRKSSPPFCRSRSPPRSWFWRFLGSPLNRSGSPGTTCSALTRADAASAHADLALAKLLLEESSQGTSRGVDIAQATRNLEASLALAPANPYAWTCLAYGAILAAAPARHVLPLLRMAGAHGPFRTGSRPAAAAAFPRRGSLPHAGGSAAPRSPGSFRLVAGARGFGPCGVLVWAKRRRPHCPCRVRP